MKLKQRLLWQYYRFLGRCARRYLSKHQIFTIGINGSVGKTSARMIIHQALQKVLPTTPIYTSPKNFNGELGMSLAIFQIEERTPSIFSMLKVAVQVLAKLLRGKKPYEITILEYGIDRPEEMSFLTSINKPHIGVFTAIDAVHSEQFGSPSEIAAEESKMLLNTREIAFLNLDDPYAQQLLPQLEIDCFTYQTVSDGQYCDIRFSNERLSSQVNSKADLDWAISLDLQIKGQTRPLQTNLLSKPNYGYLGVALAIAQICHLRFTGEELDLKALLEKKLTFQLQPWRASLFAGKHESILLDSTYNSSPLSMRKLIDTTLRVKKSLPEERKVMLILGDMRELGDLTESEHRLLAGYVHQSADQVVLLGESMHQYLADELSKLSRPADQLYLGKNALEIWSRVENFLKNSDEKWIILIKGSQNTIFLEECTKLLLQNPADAQYLTRQSDFWMQVKAKQGIC